MNEENRTLILSTSPGVTFQVSEEDITAVTQFSWYLNGRYIRRSSRPQVRLHIFLMGRAPEGLVWDHIDRDRLNNRRDNLRAVTSQQNARNHNLSRANTSGMTGVNPRIRGGRLRWRATIKVNYKRISLGDFDTIEEAAAARKSGEDRLWI